MMIGRIVGRVAIAGVVGLMVSDARAIQQMSCAQIAALSRFAGGKSSADELAKRLNIDAETVRNCLDKKAQEAKDSHASAPATK
jgi:hypothetical protein